MLLSLLIVACSTIVLATGTSGKEGAAAAWDNQNIFDDVDESPCKDKCFYDVLEGTHIVRRTLCSERDLTSVSTEPHCAFGDFRQCMQSLESIQSNDLAFAATKRELSAFCSTLRDSLVCVDDYTERCFTAAQAKMFNQVVAGARQVKDDLCVPGPIQEAYLRHAPCFVNISLSEDKCAHTNRQVAELSRKVEEQMDVDEGLRKFCCAFKEFVHCKYVHASKDCGTEAGEFVQEHLETMSSPLMDEHCPSYTYGSHTCSFAISRHYPVKVFISLCLYLIYLRTWL